MCTLQESQVRNSSWNSDRKQRDESCSLQPTKIEPQPKPSEAKKNFPTYPMGLMQGKGVKKKATNPQAGKTHQLLSTNNRQFLSSATSWLESQQPSIWKSPSWKALSPKKSYIRAALCPVPQCLLLRAEAATPGFDPSHPGPNKSLFWILLPSVTVSSEEAKKQ